MGSSLLLPIVGGVAYQFGTWGDVVWVGIGYFTIIMLAAAIARPSNKLARQAFLDRLAARRLVVERKIEENRQLVEP